MTMTTSPGVSPLPSPPPLSTSVFSSRQLGSSSSNVDFQDWPLVEPHYNILPSSSSSFASTDAEVHNNKSNVLLRASGRILHSCTTESPETNTLTTISRHGLYRCLVPTYTDIQRNVTSSKNSAPGPIRCGGFECTIQGDEMFQVLSSSGMILRITDLSRSESSSGDDDEDSCTNNIFELLTGDVFFARNGRNIRWEFLRRPTSSRSMKMMMKDEKIGIDHSRDDDDGENSTASEGSFMKVFYGFKADGYDQRITEAETQKEFLNQNLPAMIHFRWKSDQWDASSSFWSESFGDNKNTNNIILDPSSVDLDDWPFTNPKSNYKILSGDPRTSGKILDSQTSCRKDTSWSTRLGLWHCTPGVFECTEQGNEMMTVVRGRVTIRDVESQDTIKVCAGQTIFLQHHGRRVVWDIPAAPSSHDNDDDDNDDDNYNGVLKIFYGSIEGIY